MTKIEVLNEIDKKIETYQERIDIRKNQSCYYDESKRIEEYENRIEELVEVKEWINKID